METRIFNYRIIVEKEKNIYNAYCPTLGLADYGETIDGTLNRITKLVKFHIESLVESGYPVPLEKESTTIITSIEIPISSKIKFSYA